MTTAINKDTSTLNVYKDVRERGSSYPDLVSKTYSYAKKAVHFSDKTWSNLFARIFDALSHIFCKKVYARDTNSITSGWEDCIFWVKGEITDKTASLASSRFSSFDSTENPFARSKSPSDASTSTVASDPRSPASTGSSSPTSLESFEVKAEPLPMHDESTLRFLKATAKLKLRIAEEAMCKAVGMPKDTNIYSSDFQNIWGATRIPGELRRTLNEELCAALNELRSHG